MSFLSKLKGWFSKKDDAEANIAPNEGSPKDPPPTPQPPQPPQPPPPPINDQPASILDLFSDQLEKVQSKPTSRKADRGPIDIVVCVHNALGDVKKCLQSVVEKTHHRFRIILINDGSDEPTTAYLRQFKNKHENCDLLENATSNGYTKAANQGLRHSFAPTVVLLNSDTIVTPHWLTYLTEALFAGPKVGIAGPLSNAASWQSVPDIFDSQGDWAINTIPRGYDLESYSQLIHRISGKDFPRVDFLNGFCLAMKRGVIDEIGFLDEQTFPNGYGEENDYCLRAREKGYELAVADHTFVFHSKSRSYKHDRRQKLSMDGSISLIKKHGAARVKQGLETTRHHPVLVKLRMQLKQVQRSGRRN